jgi:hypothetical protein
MFRRKLRRKLTLSDRNLLLMLVDSEITESQDSLSHYLDADIRRMTKEWIEHLQVVRSKLV